ncbi:hypothetical protein A2617_02205 [Candidatus Daviesbacteria bacterium RIFOXYD1_FULL_41_10]|uniref:Thioredoxin domain-containing protein n=1 Tax=Candidatus Daviesbacteria bacterium RIFOXYD1_FULL_41_10 TaxID=1797801 RepID=A0A1F5MZY7_9BACT|nr:MAG: hypothetical protein A2617_02205 [Candidatus Daviesbacteria bacterium RIFOXYD1_FULL_41_10]
MRKFPILIIVLSLALLGGFIFISSRNQSDSSQNVVSAAPPPLPEKGTYEFFWGDGCPHCAKVEEFFKGWEATAPAKINRKEVYKNKENANLLVQRALSCGIPQNELGVPLMVTPEGKCLTGDAPIIDFLKGLK